MRAACRLPALLALAVWLSAASALPSQPSQPLARLARAYPPAPVKPLEIRVSSGLVDLRGEDRADISIEVQAPVGAIAPEAIVETEERIVVQGPAGASAQVLVRAPRATPVQFIHVADGGVAITSWRGSLQVKVERGSIEGTDLAGVIRLETGAGDITLRRAALPRDGLLRCRTLTGNVTVSLTEAPADARVLLMALRGQVRTELPVADRDGFGGRLKEGILGNGQPLLSLDAVRGDISVTVASP